MEPPDPDYILRGFDGPVTSLVFLPNTFDDNSKGAPYLLAGSQTGSLFVWNLKTRRVVHCMTSVHAHSILSVSVLDGRSEVLSQGREGLIVRWKLLAADDWRKMGTYPSGSLGFAPLAVFSLHNKSVIATSTDEQAHVAIIDVDTGELMTTLKPSQPVGMVMDIKATREDTVLAGYEDGSIVGWDARFPDREKTSARMHTEAVSSFDFCDQTQRGISASMEGTLVSWCRTDRDPAATRKVNGGIACVRARPDGKLFAVGGCDSRVHVYSGRQKLTPLAVVRAHTQSVQSLAFHRSDHTLAAGSRDKTVSVWSIYKDS